MPDINNGLNKLFEDAEKAVAGIQNEKLKEIAFSKLVNHLLNGKNSESEEEVEKPKTTATTKSKSKSKPEGPKAWISELIQESFFEKPKSSSNIIEELETRSHHLTAHDITRPLERLCHEKLLRRKKITTNGSKAILHWVNW